MHTQVPTAPPTNLARRAPSAMTSTSSALIGLNGCVTSGTTYGNAAAHNGCLLKSVPEDPPAKKPGDRGLCRTHPAEVSTGLSCDGSPPIHRRHRRCRLLQRALAERRVSHHPFACRPGQISLICIIEGRWHRDRPTSAERRPRGAGSPTRRG